MLKLFSYNRRICWLLAFFAAVSASAMATYTSYLIYEPVSAGPGLSEKQQAFGSILLSRTPSISAASIRVHTEHGTVEIKITYNISMVRSRESPEPEPEKKAQAVPQHEPGTFCVTVARDHDDPDVDAKLRKRKPLIALMTSREMSLTFNPLDNSINMASSGGMRKLRSDQPVNSAGFEELKITLLQAERSEGAYSSVYDPVLDIRNPSRIYFTTITSGHSLFNVSFRKTAESQRLFGVEKIHNERLTVLRAQQRYFPRLSAKQSDTELEEVLQLAIYLVLLPDLDDKEFSAYKVDAGEDVDSLIKDDQCWETVRTRAEQREIKEKRRIEKDQAQIQTEDIESPQKTAHRESTEPRSVKSQRQKKAKRLENWPCTNPLPEHPVDYVSLAGKAGMNKQSILRGMTKNYNMTFRQAKTIYQQCLGKLPTSKAESHSSSHTPSIIGDFTDAVRGMNLTSEKSGHYESQTPSSSQEMPEFEEEPPQSGQIYGVKAPENKTHSVSHGSLLSPVELPIFTSERPVSTADRKLEWPLFANGEQFSDYLGGLELPTPGYGYNTGRGFIK